MQSKRDHLEYEAHAAEEGEAQPSVLMPGQLLLRTQVFSIYMLSTHPLMHLVRRYSSKYLFFCRVRLLLPQLGYIH